MCIAVAFATVTIGGGTGGIDKAGAFSQRPFAQLACVEEVVIGEVGLVGLHRRTAGPQVEDGVDIRYVAGQKFFTEIRFIEVAGEGHPVQVALFGICQVVYHDNIIAAARIQRGHQVVPNKTGTAGDDGFHDASSSSRCAARMRSAIFVVDSPSTICARTTRPPCASTVSRPLT